MADTVKRQSQLHELIAVEADLVNSAKVQHADVMNTFTKRTDHFVGMSKDVKYYDEARQQENEHSEKAMVDTVDKRLDYALDIYARLFDGLFQKEEANQRANADLVVGGETLLTGIPATMLLGLETRLKLWQEIVIAIPTLEPSIPWTEDKSAGDGIFRSQDEVKKKTEKKLEYITVAQATDKHPAQIKDWTTDVAVANVHQVTLSSKWPAAKKARVLQRLDDLIISVKRARQRANQVGVLNNLHIGKVLRDYILA